VNNLPRVVARIVPRSESNQRPLDHESSALTTTPPSHLNWLMLVACVRWKEKDEMLVKQVTAAEHLTNDWSAYEAERDEAEMLVSRLETQLDSVSDTQHVNTRLQQLQVSTHCSCLCLC